MAPATPGLGAAKRHLIHQRKEVSFSWETPSGHAGPSLGLLACCQKVNCAQALLIGCAHRMAACCSGFLQLGERKMERERGEKEWERGEEGVGKRGRGGETAENERQGRPRETGSARESAHTPQQLAAGEAVPHSSAPQSEAGQGSSGASGCPPCPRIRSQLF